MEKREPSYTVSGNINCKQSLSRTAQSFLKNLELPYNTAFPYLGIYPEKFTFGKGTRAPMLTAALFTIVMTWKKHKRTLKDEWTNMWYIHLMDYYSVIKGGNNAI